MSMSGGGQSSSQTSKPLTPQEMQGYYDQAMKNLTPYMPGEDSYQAPALKTLTDGDYGALQKSMTDGYTAPLDYAKGKDLENFNNSAGAKGIWSSGLALKGERDIAEGYAPQYAKAGADATNARFALQSGENTAGNSFNLQNAAARDASKWRPADYLGQLWGMGKANVSSGSSSGAQGGFSI